MANAILTPKMITKEALRILHNQIVFTGSIRRDFDSSFANAGARIGSTLRIRKPAQFGLRDGQALNIQSFVETETTLTLSKQFGIDVEMTSAELTLDLNSFAEQVLKPQIARLATGVEDFALANTIPKVGNFKLVGTAGTGIGFADVNASAVGLDKMTTPRDGSRTFIVNPDHMQGYMDATKGLFNPNSTIADQYKSGQMQDAFGYVAKYSNLIPNYPIVPAASGVIGTAAIGPTAITLGGQDPVSGGYTTATLTFVATTGASVLKAGTIFTNAVSFNVNPENKKVYTDLYGFAVSADVAIASGATTAVVTLGSPVYTSGPLQNISATPTGSSVFIGSTAKELVQSIGFHKEAFTLGSADLVLPGGVDMAARESGDGVSMRLIRQYNSQTDQFPSRLDVIVGAQLLRPEYSFRLIGGV